MEYQLPIDYTALTARQRREVRLQYIKLQENKCYYCQGSLNSDPPLHIAEKNVDWSLFPKDFLKHPIHLQHCHNTNMTEGAVHAYCNAVMWQYHGK